MRLASFLSSFSAFRAAAFASSNACSSAASADSAFDSSCAPVDADSSFAFFVRSRFVSDDESDSVRGLAVVMVVLTDSTTRAGLPSEVEVLVSFAFPFRLASFVARFSSLSRLFSAF